MRAPMHKLIPVPFWSAKMSTWWLGTLELLFIPAYYQKNAWLTIFVAAIEAFQAHVLEVSQSEWKKCLDNWFKACKENKYFWRSLRKNIKSFLIKNIRNFIMRPELNMASYVFRYVIHSKNQSLTSDNRTKSLVPYFSICAIYFNLMLDRRSTESVLS